jgi:trk system potassium uptake protein TrkA
VARVSNLDIRADSDLLRLKELGVDLAINPKEECAVELAYMLQLPGAEEVVDLLQGRVLALGFKVSADSPLLRQTLKDCLPQEILRTVRFIAVQRGDDLSIPFGDARFMVGDDLYVVGQPDALPALMDVVYPDRPKIAKAIIAGGGSLGLSLARQLEPSGLDIVLIEMDGRTADACSNVLDRTLVLHGDAMSQETLENAGIGENTAFVSTTGSDENNIIMCLLAQKAGASFTVGSVSKPDYVPVINNLSLLDRAVSPHLSMMNSILHFIRGRNVRAATLFHTLPGELLEIMVETGHAWAGRAVRDLGMPKGTILATMERGGDVLVPTGDTLLGVGDRLVVFALPGAVKKLGHIMNA